jgi:hypothetical protein
MMDESAANRRGDVNDIPDNELLSRAIKSLINRRGRVKRPLWTAVMDTFALGSTYSSQLCRRFGHDPDMTVRR